MLNSYTNNKFNFDINAVSGTLRKSHPKSRFLVRNADSSTYVFDNEPTDYYHGNKIVVLQCMLIGDGKCIVEVVNESDFEGCA